jgi:ribosomal protein L7/L12
MSFWNKLFGGDSNPPTPTEKPQSQVSMSEEVQRLARDPAQKIAAIKLHREQTGLGLAEAKANIEDFTKTIQ